MLWDANVSSAPDAIVLPISCVAAAQLHACPEDFCKAHRQASNGSNARENATCRAGSFAGICSHAGDSIATVGYWGGATALHRTLLMHRLDAKMQGGKRPRFAFENLSYFATPKKTNWECIWLSHCVVSAKTAHPYRKAGFGPPEGAEPL